VNIVMVSYKGMGPALLDLIAGHVDIAFANPAASQEYVRSGRLRALAVTGEKRSPSIAALGADLAGGPPERLAEHLRAEIPKWREVVRAANIRL
jgi:tripartite-type tricarboxylate transporter receptor subunit TctC